MTVGYDRVPQASILIAKQSALSRRVNLRLGIVVGAIIVTGLLLVVDLPIIDATAAAR